MIHRLFISRILYWFLPMRHLPLIVSWGLLYGLSAAAQNAPPEGPRPGAPLSLTLKDAIQRARANSRPILSANIAALVAGEDAVEARAALLPGVSTLNQFIYTQPNGAPSGVLMANDGPPVYNNQIPVHGNLYAPQKIADWHKSQPAEAVAHAKADIAGRGLIAPVVGNYYGMVSAARRYANAQLSQREAQQFLDITQNLERGGEAAHSDVRIAEIQFVARPRHTQEAQLAMDQARIGFTVILFPDFRQDFTVVDDLDVARPLPAFADMQALAGKNNPDIRAALATVEQQRLEVKSSRAAMLPSLSFDFSYGMNANEPALYNHEGFFNLGSVAQAQLTIPVGTWGAARSRVKPSELRLQQARKDLSLTERQLLSKLDRFYREADVGCLQISSLRHSMDLAAESLKLTRYEAGEVTVLEVVDGHAPLVRRATHTTMAWSATVSRCPTSRRSWHSSHNE